MGKNKNKLKDKAMTAVSKVKANLKETYYQLAHIPSVSVQQLADFIRTHPDTQVSKKELLGIHYSFYKLQAGNENFYLETNGSRILQLDGYANGEAFVSYRSYRDSYDLNTPIKLN
ncbi:hypothetical protein [Bacillus sp. FJAT-27251]|uniref:hypothetical protein n=1 Tax=Bacillus sp. FJAT-27251 TaxID=1684142 RepID=UPI0006A78BD0|nr:hypothetical protein [Bacillus sp. FJAT-27251]